ncbi:hypothetical protein AsAng_0028450 [Aureispira anguillae]|uniref:Uncharacterized protein n=1 Tax=Aureispira anguillae TaxID=2864201 RepID=A0A916DTX5_9BACT|nr:hypothetical protein AsAng_0028450 [Aureispira anguillae]
MVTYYLSPYSEDSESYLFIPITEELSTKHEPLFGKKKSGK